MFLPSRSPTFDHSWKSFIFGEEFKSSMIQEPKVPECGAGAIIVAEDLQREFRFGERDPETSDRCGAGPVRDPPRCKVLEAPIEVHQSGDIVEAKLADGEQAYLKLKREPGADGKGLCSRT
jgi:hypothetical protein